MCQREGSVIDVIKLLCYRIRQACDGLARWRVEVGEGRYGDGGDGGKGKDGDSQKRVGVIGGEDVKKTGVEEGGRKIGKGRGSRVKESKNGRKER